MKLSEAVLITGIVSSAAGALGLLTSVFLTDISAGGFVVAAAADQGGPWLPAADVAAAGDDATGDWAVVAMLARLMHRGQAAKIGQ